MFFFSFLKRYMHDINIAVESILANKLRSVLTALGIIFGVAAVISMMAIGNGAQQEILEQIKMVGVNNIIITPVIPQFDDGGGGGDSEETVGSRFSPGLTIEDAESIQNMVSSVKMISPEITINSFVVQSGIREQAKLVAVSKEYFQMYDLPLAYGHVFDVHQEEKGLAV